ncbi:MAG: sulfotransferase [Magnetococcales bacterium]|nr:sulfotransferase [Magnetococcales bacterium]
MLIDPWFEGVPQAVTHYFHEPMTTKQVTMWQGIPFEFSSVIPERQLHWLVIQGVKDSLQLRREIEIFFCKLADNGVLAVIESLQQDELRLLLAYYEKAGLFTITHLGIDGFIVQRKSGLPDQAASAMLKKITQTTILTPLIGARKEETAPSESHQFVFEIMEQTVINRPWQEQDLSVYCLDFQSEIALLTRGAKWQTLQEATFHYLPQYHQTKQLIATPFSQLNEWAKAAPKSSGKVIFLFSMGRCGSTLVNQIFRAIPDFVALSEPDAHTNIAMVRQRYGSLLDSQLKPLIQSCLTLDQAAVNQYASQGFLVKFRSHVTPLISLYHRSRPDAHILYMYRDARPWRCSVTRNWYHNNPENMAQAWASNMAQAQQAQQSGVPLIPIRYESLLEHPHETLQKLFAMIGVPSLPMEKLSAILNRDSQSASPLAKDRHDQCDDQLWSTEKEHAFLETIARHPIVNTPSFRLPNTL